MLFWTIVLKDCLDNYRVINYYNIYNCCQNFAVIVCPMLLEFLFDCYFPFTDTNYFSLSHWYMFWKFFRNTTIVMKIEFILFMSIFIHVNHKDILWNSDKYTISNKNIFSEHHWRIFKFNISPNLDMGLSRLYLKASLINLEYLFIVNIANFFFLHANKSLCTVCKIIYRQGSMRWECLILGKCTNLQK